MAETSKAFARRQRTGFFEKYVPLDRPGIDIGCGNDPINQVFRQYDHLFGCGDATHCSNLPDNSFYTVLSSHTLEHLADPWSAVRNWYRITAPGGHLIVMVPHRDLYEKRKTLPSRWNGEHKHFYMPEEDEPPHTLGLRKLIREQIPSGEIVHFDVCDEGWVDLGPNVHSCGEYSIECVVRKPEGVK